MFSVYLSITRLPLKEVTQNLDSWSGLILAYEHKKVYRLNDEQITLYLAVLGPVRYSFAPASTNEKRIGYIVSSKPTRYYMASTLYDEQTK